MAVNSVVLRPYFLRGFMLRRFFHPDALMTLLLTFAAMWLLQFVALKVDFLNPLARSVTDFQLTDVVFANLRTEEVADTNIVLVNIGELDRAGIARQIERISAATPKVIGIDAFFLREKSPELDDPLAAAIAAAPQVILCSKLRYNSAADRFDSLIVSHPIFSRRGASGFANLINEDESNYKTARKFSPAEVVENRQEPAFATAIARAMNPEAAERLLARGNPLETINFRGDYGHFYTLDAGFADDPAADISFVRGKAVIFGYLGRSLQQSDLVDRFFTPLNPRPAGRTLPDMYGVVIHANIISMIVRGDYINELPEWAENALNIATSYCFVAFFGWLYVNKSRWYDTISVILQLALSLGLLFCQYLLFELFRFRLGMALCVAIIALSGNVQEVYYDVLKNAARNLRRKKPAPRDA